MLAAVVRYGWRFAHQRALVKSPCLWRGRPLRRCHHDASMDTVECMEPVIEQTEHDSPGSSPAASPTRPHSCNAARGAGAVLDDAASASATDGAVAAQESEGVGLGAVNEAFGAESTVEVGLLRRPASSTLPEHELLARAAASGDRALLREVIAGGVNPNTLVRQVWGACFARMRLAADVLTACTLADRPQCAA